MNVLLHSAALRCVAFVSSDEGLESKCQSMAAFEFQMKAFGFCVFTGCMLQLSIIWDKTWIWREIVPWFREAK